MDESSGGKAVVKEGDVPDGQGCGSLLRILTVGSARRPGVATKLRCDLGIDVEMVYDRYGEYKVLVDGQTVIDGGALTALGAVPDRGKVVEAVAPVSRPSVHSRPLDRLPTCARRLTNVAAAKHFSDAASSQRW